MANKSFSYKFDYSFNRESKSFENGIKSKPCPYKFNYASGFSHGSYRFRYDRRDRIHIEDNVFQYVRFADNIIKEDSNFQYVRFPEELIRNKMKSLTHLEHNEFLLSEYMSLKKVMDNQIIVDKDYLVTTIVRNIERENNEIAFRKYKYIYKNEDVMLELIRVLELEKEKEDYLLEKVDKFLYKNIDKNYITEKKNDLLYKDTSEYLNHVKYKNLEIEEDSLNLKGNQTLAMDIESQDLKLKSIKDKKLNKEDTQRMLDELTLKEVVKFDNLQLDLHTIIELIEDVSEIENLALNKDNELDKFYSLMLELNTYMELDKDISKKMIAKIMESFLELEDENLLEVIDGLKDMDKDLRSKDLRDTTIGNIEILLKDKILDKITFLDIDKEDESIGLSKKTIKNISKHLNEKLLEISSVKEMNKNMIGKLMDITIQEVKKDLKETLLDRVVELDIEKEQREQQLSIEYVKNINDLLEDIKLDDVSYVKVEKEIQQTLVEKFHYKDISKIKVKDLVLNTYNHLGKNIKQYILDRFNSKNIFKDYESIQVEKQSHKYITLEETINLILSFIDDIDIEDIEPYYRKAIPDIEKEFEKLIEDHTLRWIYERISNIKLEECTIKFLLKDIIESFTDEKVNKNLNTDLNIVELEKDIIGEILKDKLESLLEVIRTTLLYKEKDIAEFLQDSSSNKDISLDGESLLDVESLRDIIKDNDLIDVITSILIEVEDRDLDLGPSPTKEILVNLIKELKKQRILEFIIDENLPLARVYREINKNKPDIQALREQSIVKETSIELSQKFRDIDKFEEKNLDLYKRFWFLRATDPLDWKIVPYDNFPYEDDSVIFDENKQMIPDNWQLEMVDVENKMFKKIDNNPVPFGKDVSNVEMALSVEIMIEMINILILLWSRLFYAFTGYTGTQSVTRLTRTLYEWLTLETSISAMDNKESKEHYMRAYRWIRWEAEKVSIKGRDDMNLNGNCYIDEFIYELIYYMENHHFDTMPLFKVVEVMDEYRALVTEDEPQGDIEFVLDKVKGMRHKILDCREKRNNE